MVQDNLAIRTSEVRELIRSRRLDEAHSKCAALCQDYPDDPEAWFLLGSLAGQGGDFSQAAAYFHKTIALDPNHFAAHYNLGRIYQSQSDFSKAERCYRSAVDVNPRFADACARLGHVLLLANRLDEAKAYLGKAQILDPRSPRILHDLALVKHWQGRYSEALLFYQRTLEADPENSAALSDLGLLYKDTGQIDEAIDVYRRAVAAQPASVQAHQNLCLILNYKVGLDAGSLYDAHVETAQLYGHPASGARFRSTSVDTKPLKVGYVSSDYRTHPIAYFIEALFRRHDRGQVEVAAYSTTRNEDETSARLRRLADRWISAAGLNDDQLADRIRGDGIDILVDLSGHTGGNRLGVFARRAAPVQVTYLGYPNTTALQEMDYRLTDHFADPRELHPDDFYTEELVRLPRCFTCYTPPSDAPEISPLPAQSKGHVTYASLNNLPKINDRVVALWAEIMNRVDRSRLILQSAAFSDTGVRTRVEHNFARHDIDAGRLVLRDLCSLPEHLALYHDIDIALDPFPWNGHTTTCHALWMGVPVVALAGRRHASRMSFSVLSNVALPDWIAGDEQAYVDTAVDQAGRLNDLQGLRSTMRDRLLRSSLCDGETFARDVEHAYRRMWRRWCERQS